MKVQHNFITINPISGKDEQLKKKKKSIKKFCLIYILIISTESCNIFKSISKSVIK